MSKFNPLSLAEKFLGIDLKGLEPEAEALWKQLDTLSRTDPLAYERFIASQMQADEEYEKQKQTKEDKTRAFRPDVGFSIRSVTQGGEEGVLVREVNSTRRLIVNICSSKIVEEGKNLRGNIPGIGPQIPMLIGKPRRVKVEIDDEEYYEESEEKDDLGEEVELDFLNINFFTSLKKSTGIVVDVIVNPNVIELCNENSFFKAQIIDLVLNWIKEETEMDIDLAQKKINHNSNYYGGLGEKKDIPILFTITEEMLQEEEDRNNGIDPKEKKKKKNKEKEKEAVNLLNEIKKDKNSANDTSSSSSTFITPTEGTNPIEKTSSILLPHQQVSETNESKSEEKVIKKPLIQEIGGDSSSPILPSTIPATNTSSSTKVESEPLFTEKKLVPPSKSEIERAQDILSEIDPDYKGINSHQLNEEMSNKLISTLSKSLLPELKLGDNSQANSLISSLLPNATIDLNSASNNNNKFQVGERNPYPSSINLKTEISKNEKNQKILIVSLSGLAEGIRSSDLNLEVNKNVVKISTTFNSFKIVPSDKKQSDKVEVEAIVLNNSYNLVASEVSASFKKKKGLMTITVPYISL